MPSRITQVLIRVALLVLTFSVLLAPAYGAERLGVVLLHDKNGSPGKAISEVERVLRNVGFLVITPELPWSSKRGFDATYQQALVEIGLAAQELRVEGCDKVALVGHGLGANAALAYAATRPGILAVVALAPSHSPELHQEVFLPDVRKARSMLTIGSGQKRSLFTDFNMDKDYDLSTTAEVYLSFNDPEGEAVMPRSCAALKKDVPLLWVVGLSDPLSHLGRYYAYAKAPSNPNSRYEEVAADHLGVPRMAAQMVASWLREILRGSEPAAGKAPASQP